tara:strand:+ start:744 stop:1166 length:423 start_codon:yes stop_codon:yes gene_type:complete
LNKKISDKDRKDWQVFTSNKDKLPNKDFIFNQNNNEKEIIKTIDLHGISLENANNVVEEFITKCFENNVSKIIVITGKGLRSKSDENPYVSKDLSILKHAVPNFIKSKQNLMKVIKGMKEANVEDGGQGAFYIFLKKIEE